MAAALRLREVPPDAALAPTLGYSRKSGRLLVWPSNTQT
jgi:hypothetical protein